MSKTQLCWLNYWKSGKAEHSERLREIVLFGFWKGAILLGVSIGLLLLGLEPIKPMLEPSGSIDICTGNFDIYRRNALGLHQLKLVSRSFNHVYCNDSAIGQTTK